MADRNQQRDSNMVALIKGRIGELVQEQTVIIIKAGEIGETIVRLQEQLRELEVSSD